MAKNYVEMGGYYSANPYGLVRTVCKGVNEQSGEAVICYVYVGEGANASDIFMMPESDFKNIFLK